MTNPFTIRAEPPLSKGDRAQIEAWYRWALQYPAAVWKGIAENQRL
jgi:hypothetical protein